MSKTGSSAPSRKGLLISLVAIVVGMTMLTFASVPLYRLFCQVTGLGGTTQEADHAPGAVSGRKMNVRFNADVSPELDWSFHAEQRQVEVVVGEEYLASFVAKNTGKEAVNGVAIYNVTPHAAAEYFSKIACFCFDNQRLEAGEEMVMPVSFFIDPAIEEDPYLKNLETVTLSYTFFKSKNQGIANTP
ncbi:MAG: cytochrome c oxidase assembly protein [Rickettsiales bacterium]